MGPASFGISCEFVCLLFVNCNLPINCNFIIYTFFLNPLHANVTAVNVALYTRINEKVPSSEAPSIEMSRIQRVNYQYLKY